MNSIIIILLLILVGTNLYTIFVISKSALNVGNQSELEKKLETALNHILLSITEKQSIESSRLQEYIINYSKGVEQTLQSHIHALSEKLLTSTHTQSEQTQKQITRSLQESSLSLLSQSKIELAKIQESNKESIQSLISLSRDRLNQINIDVQKRLDENFARNIKSFEEVTKNLGQIEQKAQHMIESTKSIDKLNAIFTRTNSKGFGAFSERYLESMLEKYLDPETWKSQVSFAGSQEKIDFVIYFADKQIGIDSKFPLTKYNDYIQDEDPTSAHIKRKEFIRTVKDMAKSISQKYLRNSNLDTLLLYLPSDAMYLECLHEGDAFMDTIHEYGVSLISPNTLFPQLVIIQSYHTQVKISSNARTIIDGLATIHKKIGLFQNEYVKLGDKLRQAQNNYDAAHKSLDIVSRNIQYLQHSDSYTEEEEKTLL